MIRPSAGTAQVLGLKKMAVDDPPTCAYLMVGNRCEGSCLFCAQRSSEDSPDRGERSKLSRISWNPAGEEEVLTASAEKFEKGVIKRLCFQVVRGEDTFNQVKSSLKKLKSLCDIPVCISITGINKVQIEELLKTGAEKIAFSFDAASPELYRKIKNRPYEEEWNLFVDLNKKYPGCFVIHLIAGLGETGGEMAETIENFYKEKAEVSLFAFTPLPNTPLARKKPPSLSYYRKLQGVLYLIRNGITINKGQLSRDYFDKYENYFKQLNADSAHKGEKDLSVKHQREKLPQQEEKIKEENNEYLYTIVDGEVVFNEKHKAFLMEIITRDAFQTYGCPDCNRPLYNERPGQIPYNYPRPLKEDERIKAVEMMF